MITGAHQERSTPHSPASWLTGHRGGTLAHRPALPADQGAPACRLEPPPSDHARACLRLHMRLKC